MSYKKIRPDTMNELTMNVFMLLSDFNPATFNPATGIDGTKIIASTTGGVSFSDSPEFEDWGEDIDNCPKNTMELKRKKDGEVKISGNLVTVNLNMLGMLIAASTTTGNKVTPKTDLSTSDFSTLWGVADYGDGGIIAIKMKRVLNTSGISISTTDEGKAQFAFEFTCHKTITDLTDPPYEVYIIDGETVGGVELNTHNVTVAVGGTVTLTASTVPDGQTVTWSSANTSKAEVSNGVVTGAAAGNTIITATITVDGVSYSDTCTVVVTAAS